MTEDTTKTLQQLLWDAELILRRQLQAVDEAAISPGSNIDSPPHIDPNIYTHTQAQSEEDLSQSRGRTVLTILYLCVLGLCFVVPVFYYFRLHCFEENARRELELDFTTALEQSEQHREESRAARRKYIEERRARIVQLLGPVRMMLKEANFPHLTDPDAAPKRTGSFLNLNFESEKHGRSDNESATMTSEDILSPYTSDDDDEEEEEHDENASPPVNGRSAAKDNRVEKEIKQQQPKTQPQRGVIETKSECESAEEENNIKNKPPQDEPGKGKPPKRDNQNNPYGDEDTFFVRIPVPGLPLGGSCLLDPTRLHRHEDNWKRDMRLAPGLCTICLSNYKVGSDIVWSSNEACDHHFHTSCIEKWLMKQREGPLCPCCRRDFIVDPLDLLEEENNNNNNNNNNNSPDNERNENNTTADTLPVVSWDPATLEEDPDFGPIIVAAPDSGTGNFACDPTRLEEGLSSPANNAVDDGEEQQN